MRILIAGGGGYIGTQLCNKLFSSGHDVTVVDLFWFGNYLNKEIPIIRKNVMDLTEEEVRNHDAVVFMAGLSNDPMANFSPKVNFIENSAAPTFLAFLAKKSEVPRFVYASSCSVYGFTDNEIMTEESKTSPQYPYGISKLQAENTIMSMADDNFRPIALRKGTVGGWSERMRFDLVVNTMLKSALTDKKIIVHNPNLWRPLIDIRDVVQAYEKSIFSDLKITGVFNICSKNYTIGELSNIIYQKLIDSDYEVEVEIHKNYDVRNYLASNKKACEVLHFTPRYNPEDSIEEILLNIKNKVFNFYDKKYYNINVFKDLFE